MTSTCAPSKSAAFAPVIDQLHGLVSALRCVNDEQYAASPVGALAGSIGEHIRHCLDHVQALVAAAQSGEADYERRDRGGAVERDRAAAIAHLESLAITLASLAPQSDQPVRVTVLLSPDDAPTRLDSTLAREVAFVASHTVHHSAIIGAMVRTLGGQLPPWFGYAPSTIAHLRQSSCVR